MPEQFDLLRVEYFSSSPTVEIKKHGLAYAPIYTVNVGDIVDIGFARGFVTDKIPYCDKDDPFLRLTADVISIPCVVYKLQKMKYGNDVD